MKIITATLTGTENQRLGSPSQDSLLVGESKDGGFVVAMADGASAALYGDLAAHTQTSTAVSYYRRYNPDAILSLSSEDAVHDLFCALLHNLKCVAARRRAKRSDARQYSATFLCAAEAEETILCTHIGDGSIVAFTSDNRIEIISSPYNGLCKSHTAFVVSADAEEKAHYCVIEKARYKALLLTTDGAHNAFESHDFEKTVKSLFEEYLYGDLPDSFALTSLLLNEFPNSAHYDDWTVALIDLENDERPSTCVSPVVLPAKEGVSSLTQPGAWFLPLAPTYFPRSPVEIKTTINNRTEEITCDHCKNESLSDEGTPEPRRIANKGRRRGLLHRFFKALFGRKHRMHS